MGSKKNTRAKRKKAAELARRNAIAEKNVNKKVAEAKETGQEAKTTLAEEIALRTSADAEKPAGEFVSEIKEIVECKQEKTSVKKDGKSKGNTIGGKLLAICNKLSGGLKNNSKSGIWIASAVAAGLLIAVIALSVRLGGVSKELESMQAMSVSLQEELEEVKRDRDEAELELFSKEPETVYIEVYPTVTPMPTPEPMPVPEVEKYVVCVDAGHGDWDGGACIEGENYQILRAEKDDNLWMAKLFRDALEEYEDVEVVMTRETDVFLELSERTDIANEAEADALISFHRNSFDGENDVSGVEFWIHSSRPSGAQKLASGMLNAIMQVGGMENRGVKHGSMSSFREDYSINRKANMTSMIIELGFITSEKDNTAYDTNGEAYAKEMAKVVHDWLLEQ